jgi:hypothetical protein
MAIYGENSDPRGLKKKGFLTGGFFEVDHMFKPWLGLCGRIDVLTIKNSASHIYTDAGTISLRVYPHHNLKIAAEYQRQDHGMSSIGFLADITF